jgi:prepilin-type processing-associated H-X9-DG protein
MIPRARSASGFTLMQLLRWSAITMGLILLIYPRFAPKDLCDGIRPTCMGNLKQLSLAVLMYAQDYDDTYPAYDVTNDHWGPGPWGKDGQNATDFRSRSRWGAQLQPYVRRRDVFACPSDSNGGRNQTESLTPGSTTPFPVSYGPNRLFIDPKAYAGKKRTVTTASVQDPAEKYLLGDCAIAAGFDPETIAYLRYPNYDPHLRQNGWSPEQYRAAGRVAWPDNVAEPLTRHNLGSNIMFADGHVRWLRHDRIPDNDGPHGEHYHTLVGAMVPWQPAATAGDEPAP